MDGQWTDGGRALGGGWTDGWRAGGRWRLVTDVRRVRGQVNFMTTCVGVNKLIIRRHVFVEDFLEELRISRGRCAGGLNRIHGLVEIF